MSTNISAMFGTALLMTLTACGGGGDDDDEDAVPAGPGWSTPPAPPATPTAGATVDGIFRDALVEGLDFSDGGALSGITGANGRFQYAQGNAVTFRIGGLTLGSLLGQPFMTPMHLIGTTTSATIAINNRLRLLQMLDLDNNPENGIVVSNAVRAIAAGWTTPDFDLSYTAFASAVEPLRLAASTADGVTHALPSETTASAHFARTAWCTYSGLYRGAFGGSGDSGVWTMVVYGQGLMFGGGYSTVDRAGFELQRQSTGLLSIFPAFTAGQASTGASFSGSLRTPNLMQGTWTNTPDTGTFVGGRSGGTDSARYRINGYQFPVGTALLIALEVDASNQVSGQIIDRDYLRTAEPVAVTGTLSGTTLTAAASGNVYTINGTFNTANPASLVLTGTLRDNVKARDVNLNNLQGCKLN